MNDGAGLSVEFPKRRSFRRKSNKRVVVQRKPVLVAAADGVGAVGRAVGRGVAK